MLKSGGYAIITSPSPTKVILDGGRTELACEGVTEYDTFSCGHCGHIKHVKAKERPEDLGGLCKSCMKLICPSCVNEGRCTPLEKRIEQMEQRDMTLRSYGMW